MGTRDSASTSAGSGPGGPAGPGAPSCADRIVGARRGTAAERTSRGPRAEPATYRVGEEGRRDPGPLRGLAELQLRRHRPAELHPLPGRAAAGGRGAGLLLGEGSKGRWAPTPPGPPDTSARTLRRILLAGTATGGSDSFRGRDGAEESLLPAIPPRSQGTSPGPPHALLRVSHAPIPSSRSLG